MKSLLVVLSLFVGSFAVANDAGCGLGGMLIKQNTKLMQVIAVTLNGTGVQTFAISTGTSGCTAAGIVKNDKQIQYFVEVNQEELTREMAQGHGEKLTTLAALNGCSSNDQVSAFNTKAQASFSSIVPSAKTSAVDFVNNMKSSSISDVCQGS